MQSNIPGYENVATALMKKTIANNGVASIAQLRDLCMEAGVRMLACQMTVELFGFEESDFIDGCEYVGAASYLDIASEAKINFFV